MRMCSRLSLYLAVFMTFVTSANAQTTCTSGSGGTTPATAAACATPAQLVSSLTTVATARLTLSTASTTLSSVGTGVTVADYELAVGAGTGLVVVGPLVTVNANSGYTVTMTNANLFTSPAPAKNSTTVSYSTNAVAGVCGAAYTPFSNPFAAVTLMTSASATASQAVQVCFQVKWLWATDAPGSYTLPITFKVTMP